MAQVTLVWHGGPHTVVALDREIDKGEEVTVDKALADSLLAASGFTLKDGSNPLAQEAPQLAGREALEAKANELGLAIYPTEDDAGLADRISSAGGDPSAAGAKAPSASGRKPSSKDEAKAEAEALGVGVSGTEKEIRARIAKERERLAQDQGGSDSGADGDEQQPADDEEASG